MKNKIESAVNDGIKAIQTLKESEAINFIDAAAKMIADCYQNGNKVIIAGNGGSLCDAMHFSEELSGFFRAKRRALPAMAVCEQGFLTCVANDVGFNYVFARAVEAHGKPGDIFVALTTSGNSENLKQAIETARMMGLKTIVFLGKTGGSTLGLGDLEWVVRGFNTSDRIQEAHMCAIHIIIEMVEEHLFGSRVLLEKMQSAVRK